MSTNISVVVSAKFPQAKPAHHAFIQKTGTGTNLNRAVRDAVNNIFTDSRLKGKRASNVLPAVFTINTMEMCDAEEES